MTKSAMLLIPGADSDTFTDRSEKKLVESHRESVPLADPTLSEPRRAVTLF